MNPQDNNNTGTPVTDTSVQTPPAPADLTAEGVGETPVPAAAVPQADAGQPAQEETLEPGNETLPAAENQPVVGTNEAGNSDTSGNTGAQQ